MTCRDIRQVTCVEEDSWHITVPVVVLRQCAQLRVCATPGSIATLQKVHEFEWEKFKLNQMLVYNSMETDQ